MHLFERVLMMSEARRTAQARAPSFVQFLTSPDFCGMMLSPVVQAIAEASEGIAPTRISEADAQRLFRSARGALGTGTPPQVVGIGAGRRGGKTSRLLAPKAVHAAWTVPLPDLRPGEIGRSVLIAPDLDLSKGALDYATGIVENSAVLREARVNSPADRIVLRRPDGRLCEIVTGAASRGGKAARSRSLVFAGLDEAAFFFSDDGHVANDKTIYEAALAGFGIPPPPGAQIWVTSTPWIEEEGLLEEFVRDRWGDLGGGFLIAARVTSYELRGIQDDGSLRKGRQTPESYDREILAIPYPKGSFGFFPAADVRAALEQVVPAGAPEAVAAGGDFGHAAFRDNSALVVSARFRAGIFVPRHAAEIVSTPGRKPSETYRAFGEQTKSHGARSMTCDAHYKEAVKEVVQPMGIQFLDAPSKAESYCAVRDGFAERRIVLTGLEENIRRRLVEQLGQIVGVPLVGGGVKIIAPRTRPDRAALARGEETGGHCDIVSALVTSLWAIGIGDRKLWVDRPPIQRTILPRRTPRDDLRLSSGGREDYR